MEENMEDLLKDLRPIDRLGLMLTLMEANEHPLSAVKEKLEATDQAWLDKFGGEYKSVEEAKEELYSLPIRRVIVEYITRREAKMN